MADDPWAWLKNGETSGAAPSSIAEVFAPTPVASSSGPAYLDDPGFQEYLQNHLTDVENGTVMRLSDADLYKRYTGDWSGGLNASELFRDQSNASNPIPDGLSASPVAVSEYETEAGVATPQMPDGPVEGPSAQDIWNTGQAFGGAGGSGGGQSDGGGMEWNWDYFQRPGGTDTGGFGGYQENYDASRRYSPGDDAWWGSDKFPGDNRDFYQNQFGNLLSQEQGFQKAQRTAEAIRAEQAANPQAPAQMDWSWMEGGLPEVEVMQNGYASPMPGQGMDTGDFGYQQGGAAYIFDPTVGGFRLNNSAGGTLSQPAQLP